MDYTTSYATLVTITYYNEDEGKELTDNCLIYARNMHDVADFVETYYGKDATQVNTIFIGDTVVHLTEDSIDKLMRCDNWDLIL